jgi:hypothetical protein
MDWTVLIIVGVVFAAFGLWILCCPKESWCACTKQEAIGPKRSRRWLQAKNRDGLNGPVFKTNTETGVNEIACDPLQPEEMIFAPCQYGILELPVFAIATGGEVFLQDDNFQVELYFDPEYLSPSVAKSFGDENKRGAWRIRNVKPLKNQAPRGEYRQVIHDWVCDQTVFGIMDDDDMLDYYVLWYYMFDGFQQPYSYYDALEESWSPDNMDEPDWTPPIVEEPIQDTAAVNWQETQTAPPDTYESESAVDATADTVSLPDQSS